MSRGRITVSSALNFCTCLRTAKRCYVMHCRSKNSFATRRFAKLKLFELTRRGDHLYARISFPGHAERSWDCRPPMTNTVSINSQSISPQIKASQRNTDEQNKIQPDTSIAPTYVYRNAGFSLCRCASYCISFSLHVRLHFRAIHLACWI